MGRLRGGVAAAAVFHLTSFGSVFGQINAEPLLGATSSPQSTSVSKAAPYCLLWSPQAWRAGSSSGLA